jgi:hypothetical protein
MGALAGRPMVKRPGAHAALGSNAAIATASYVEARLMAQFQLCRLSPANAFRTSD